MSDQSDLSKLLSSATLVLFGGILGASAKLVERIVIARVLTLEAYGEVNIALAVMTVGATISLVGFRQGVPRYVSRFDDEADIRGAWLTGLLVTTGVSALTVGVFVLSNARLIDLFFEQETSTQLLLLFVLTIPFKVSLDVGIGAIRGFENTIYKTYAKDLYYRGSRIVFLVILLYAGFGILAAGYAYLIAAVTAFLFAHVLLSRLMPLVGEFDLHTKEMMTFSAPLIISTVIGLLLSKTDTLMLGYFRSSAEVGLYSAAYPLANGMLVILSSFGFMYLPMTSRLDSNDKRDEVDSIYKVTTKWIYIITFPAFLVFVVFSSDVLSIIFGAEYAEAGLALTILAVGFFTNAAGGRNRETLSALGYTNYILLTNSVAFVLNVAMNLLLIPLYGYIGAAVASAASFVTFNVLVIGILSYKFDISPFSRWSVRTFLLLPLLLIPPAWVVSQWVTLTIVTLPIVLVLTGILSLLVAGVTGCFQPEDRIPIELIEERIGVQIPFVDGFVPEREMGGNH